VSRILVLGGGVCGLAAGMVLARDGHAVTLLERDPAPAPGSMESAWSWERGGVPHFRQPHGLQPRARQVLDAELPDVAEALLAGGATPADPIALMPPTIADRRRRPGDERFWTLSVRRPALEQVVARAADEQPGLTVRRGTAAAALLTRGMNGSSHVTGVRTDAGEELYADLVVDAMGRGSRLPRLLADAGLEPSAEQPVGARFVYYTRYFRGDDQPELRAARLSPVGSFSIVTLNGDNDTWSVTLFAAAGDRPLKRLRDVDAWTRVVRACPRQAHWLDGEPITGVLPMAGVMDRHRTPAPPATGVVSVADAWACTNPTLGRGIALGLMHVALLRDVVRERLGDRRALAAEWRERTERELAPWYRECIEADRVRLADMEAHRAGRTPDPPSDPAAQLRAALFAAMPHDADAFRAGMEVIGCLATPAEVLARPGFADHVRAVAAGRDAPAPVGPGRDELLRLIA
jgi:2-polyprenyl-6-methoxyphenol hydroxylase-like FAD-dependent oxidoreductase